MTSFVKRGLIVSCQAEPPSPFNAPPFVAAFAQAAEMGGAVGVRVCGADNIRAVRAAVSIPIIGITKNRYADGTVLITEGRAEAEAIVEAGASAVALDATFRTRPGGLTGTEVLSQVVRRLQAPVIADVSTFDEAIAAVRAGAHAVATTLSGYTRETAGNSGEEPDLDLVARLGSALEAPVIAEGRYWTAAQAAEALKVGGWAVVVGTAITRPVEIVRRFVRELERPVQNRNRESSRPPR